MFAVRALQRRVERLELAGRPPPSPFTRYYGSIDEWVDWYIIPDIRAGRICPRDMIDVVAAIRRWEEDGHYAA